MTTHSGAGSNSDTLNKIPGMKVYNSLTSRAFAFLAPPNAELLPVDPADSYIGSSFGAG